MTPPQKQQFRESIQQAKDIQDQHPWQAKVKCHATLQHSSAYGPYKVQLEMVDIS